MVFHSLKEVQTELSSKSITLKNVVSHYLQNIEARKNLNAFLEVWGDEALLQAEEIQQKIDNTLKSPLDSSRSLARGPLLSRAGPFGSVRRHARSFIPVPTCSCRWLGLL